MNPIDNHTIYVIRDSRDGLLYNRNGSWKENMKDATTWKMDDAPKDTLKYWGIRGHEWYPKYAAEAEEEGLTEKAAEYREDAANYLNLFNNCRVEEHTVQTTCVDSYGLKATSESTVVTNWLYEKAE